MALPAFGGIARQRIGREDERAQYGILIHDHGAPAAEAAYHRHAIAGDGGLIYHDFRFPGGEDGKMKTKVYINELKIIYLKRVRKIPKKYIRY